MAKLNDNDDQSKSDVFEDISTTTTSDEKPKFNTERRPSRFSVTKVEGPLIKITPDEEQPEKIEEEVRSSTKK